MLTLLAYVAAGKSQEIYVLALCKGVNLMFSV